MDKSIKTGNEFRGVYGYLLELIVIFPHAIYYIPQIDSLKKESGKILLNLQKSE